MIMEDVNCLTQKTIKNSYLQRSNGNCSNNGATVIPFNVLNVEAGSPSLRILKKEPTIVILSLI